MCGTKGYTRNVLMCSYNLLTYIHSTTTFHAYYPAVTVCDSFRGRVSEWMDLQDSLTALLFNFSDLKVLASYSCNILKTQAKCAAIYLECRLMILYSVLVQDYYQLHPQSVKIYSKYNILP